VYYRYFDIIKILILQGNANINVQDLNGKSVLHLNYSYIVNKQRKKDNNEITKFLVEHGCDVNLRDILGETVLFYEMIELYNIQEDKINSEIIKTKKLLDYAKYYDTEDEIIDLLLEHNCDVNIQNMDGESALACIYVIFI
jgi:ankyrin repeat protein